MRRFCMGHAQNKAGQCLKAHSQEKKQRHALPNIDPESALHVRTKKCCSVFYTTKPYLQVRSRICSKYGFVLENPFELNMHRGPSSAPVRRHGTMVSLTTAHPLATSEIALDRRGLHGLQSRRRTRAAPTGV